VTTRALALLLPLLLMGCFAELTAGPGIVSGGAGGVSFSVGASIGVHYDVASAVKVGVGGELRANKATAHRETFVQNHRGLTLLTDTVLAGSYERSGGSWQTLRLRVGGGWAPSTTLSLTPELTGATHHPPLIAPPGTDPSTATESELVEQPHTTWSGIAGLSYDVNEGVVGYSFGVEARADWIPSRWMGDTLIITPQARATFYVSADGLMYVFDGVSASNITVPPPPDWLRSSAPTRPDTRHSDDDINKTQREIERQRSIDKKRCQSGGPCSN